MSVSLTITTFYLVTVKVMDNENWPENIGIRPYVQRKIESSGSSKIL